MGKPAQKRTRTPRRKASARLVDRLRATLKPVDAAAGRGFHGDLLKAAKDAGVADQLAALLSEAKALRPFLAGVAEASPFLRTLMLDDPGRLVGLLDDDPDQHLARLCTTVAQCWREASEDEVMASLRRARSEVALLVALADLSRAWTVDSVTAALTAFADTALGAAAAFILAKAHAAGRIKLPDPDNPARGSGWIVLAMGKFGAGELNFSSDIDLIVFYDLAAAPLADDVEPSVQFVRMTKALVQLLSEHTGDGYVFRTDLRLRPDPGSTAIAISTDAALHYYESFGQNWERAAMIKARPVAGDIAAGEAFLREIGPFIWRRYLDFAAIADIHSIKRQIHDHRGHETIAVAGHNIKLGRGGIREIEFFVQTQQLIAGGRHPELRVRATLDVLTELVKGGWIESGAADELAESYRALRDLEHRLQMIADEQTHTLPEGEEELATVARLAGFKSTEAFAEALTATLRTVGRHYAGLFESAPPLAHDLGSLVFTGDDDHPETLETLSGLGFRHPSDVSQAVRGWHYGRYPAVRSVAARERLTEFLPALIERIAGADSPDATFAAFDRFLSRLPSGLQLFSLLGSHPELLGLLLSVLSTAPRLADIVIHRAHALDAVIEPAFFGSLPDTGLLRQHLQTSLAQSDSYEDALDRARIFGQEQSLLIGVRVIAGSIDARRAGHAYSDLADMLVASLLERVQAEFADQHGRMPGGQVALLAMGRLGGREMTAGSDLDLILLYDFSKKASGSSGERSLSGGQYYARLTQRLVAAISAPTAEGALYEVDFRLRPSGHSGPLATGIDAFSAYQEKDAWTWEHMALTRARAVAGDPKLIRRVDKEIREILVRRRDRKKLIADILEMRGILEDEKGADDPWDLKQSRGGLVDIEFVAQFLQLAHAAKHPEMLSTTTEIALANAARLDLLPAPEVEILVPALRLYQDLAQILRLCVAERFDPEDAPRDLLRLLARAADLPDFARLEAHLQAAQKEVRGAFDRLIGTG